MLAIIAGSARGRRLKTLEGEATRPTAAKVRAALMSMLAPWLPDAAWLDLYAGSGAIGLEAASRGAKRVVLVEQAAPAIAVIRENTALTKLDGVEVLPLPVDRAIPRLAGQRFDVIFLDPPYALDPVPTVEAVAETGLLAPDGRLVVEHRRDRVLPETVGTFVRLKTSGYSEACLTVYRVAGGAPSPDCPA